MKSQSKLLYVVGLVGLSCCAGSPSGFMTDMSAATPTPTPTPPPPPPPPPDMTATLAVPDCAAASLIQAINAANDESLHPGSDVIALKSGCVYSLTGPDNWWYGPTGLPAITSDITIRPEAGGKGVIIERDPSAPKFRLFYVNGAPTTNVLPGEGKLTLQNLTVRNGLARGGNGGPVSRYGEGGGGGGGLGAGGAIFVQGTLVLSGVTLTGNTAQGGVGSGCQPINCGAAGGGGMGGDGGPYGGGGGMKENGSDGLSSGTDTDGGDGPLPGAKGKGARLGFLGMGGVAVGNEHGGDATATAAGLGGGTRTFGAAGRNVLFNPGDGGSGGGNAGSGGGGAGFGGNGGAGIVRISGSTSYSGGGGAFGGGGGGGFNAQGGGGGIGGGGGSIGGAGGFGGGGSGFANGGFGGGGGYSSPQVSRFGGGTGSFSADGSLAGGGGGAGLGGAVFLMYGSMTIVNSTLTGNAAQGGNHGGGTGTGTAMGGQGLGGAVFILNGTATVVHATVSNNFVANGSNGPVLGNNGSAIYLFAFGKDAPGIAPGTATLTLSNSILADNTPCAQGAEVALVADRRSTGTIATVTATLPNLIESHGKLNSATFNGSPIIVESQLDVLKDNGGATPTQSLSPTSPAVNAGDFSTCMQASVSGRDQRGQPRGAASCHLGAVELIGISAQPRGCTCMTTSECSSNLCTGGFCE